MGQEKKIVDRTLEALKEVVELFYQQQNDQALQQFDTVLKDTMEMMDVLFRYKESHEDFSMEEDKINASLQEALEALDSRDYILLADILQYDFVEYIETVSEGMN